MAYGHERDLVRPRRRLWAVGGILLGWAAWWWRRHRQTARTEPRR